MNKKVWYLPEYSEGDYHTPMMETFANGTYGSYSGVFSRTREREEAGQGTHYPSPYFSNE